MKIKSPLNRKNFFAVLVCLNMLVLTADVADAAEPNLVGWWTFDEGSGTTAYDSAGSNDGTIYGAQWTSGRIDGALSFDGSGDYVGLSDIGFSLMGSGISSSTGFWFKINTLSPGENKAIFEQEKSLFDRYVFWFEDSTDTVNFLLDGAQATPFSISAVTWYHVVGVVNGSEGRFFVNGSEVGSAFSYTAVDTTGYLEVGRCPFNGYGGYYFNGTIDDVRIYNRALSAEEIEQLYLSGLSSFERAIVLVKDAIAEKEEMVGVIDETLEKEGWAYDAIEELLESRDYGDLNKRDIVKAKQEVHSAMQHEEQAAGALEKSIEGLYDALAALGWEPEPELDPNLISYWKFDEGGGTIAVDNVGGNHGTLYGDATWTTGVIDGGLRFSGYGWVNVPDSASLDISGDQVTVSTWYRPSTNDTSININSQIVAKWLGTNSAYALGYGLTPNHIWFGVYTGSNGVAHGPTAVDEVGKWHHIAGVYNGSEVIVYIDGVAGAVTNHTGSIYNSSKPLRISGYANGWRPLHGTVDDVRIYNRALSAEEIQQLYAGGL